MKAAWDQTLQAVQLFFFFFSRGVRAGHHGRRRLLNLLWSVPLFPNGSNLSHNIKLVFVYNILWFDLFKRKFHDTCAQINVLNPINREFCYGNVSAVVVHSVTVGPEYGVEVWDGRVPAVEASVSDSQH